MVPSHLHLSLQHLDGHPGHMGQWATCTCAHTHAQKCHGVHFLYVQSVILHLEDEGEGEMKMPGGPATREVTQRLGEQLAAGWLGYRNSEIMQYIGSHSCYVQALLSGGEEDKEWT